jgi:hypothetical protein
MASQDGNEAQGNASTASTTPENNYFPPITELTPQAEELLDKYVHLPKEEMLPHVHAMVSIFPHLRAQPWTRTHRT